ncbi:hypothetical protein VDG1235_3253 [Verrucomicrobiia bacterium DG1235]|nr:hypothetical protein VDG1235_3253 [Verrucomicrobiae bacterium DG1235]
MRIQSVELVGLHGVVVKVGVRWPKLPETPCSTYLFCIHQLDFLGSCYLS